MIWKMKKKKRCLIKKQKPFFDDKKSLSVWRLFFEDRVLEECVKNWKYSDYIGLDNEEGLSDDLIPFDLIENEEDKIFLLHKVDGGIYF